MLSYVWFLRRLTPHLHLPRLDLGFPYTVDSLKHSFLAVSCRKSNKLVAGRVDIALASGHTLGVRIWH